MVLKKKVMGYLAIMLGAVIMLPAALGAARVEEKRMDDDVTVMAIETADVPVIMYHSLVDSQAFESDLAYLKEQGYQSVFLSQMVDFVYDGVPLPEKPIVLSFDDGYYNNYSTGLSLLEKYDMKMVVSVIGSETEKWNEANYVDEKNAHVSWAQIRDMVNSGYYEIANHTWDLHKNANGRKGCAIKRGEDKEQYSRLLKEDVGKLQESFLENCGIGPVGFTYPFGSKCPEATEVLQEMGFKVTLACSNGVNTLSQGDKACLFDLHRFERAPGKSVKAILESLDGGRSVFHQIFRFMR